MSSGANNDVTVSDLERIGKQMTRIINVDDQRDIQTGEMGEEAKLAQSDPTGRWHNNRGRHQCPEQNVGPEMQGATRCDFWQGD
jgi:hypothetical protein